jgi:hypothetical protein
MMWLRQLLFRRRLYSELSAEIQEHLDERVDELVANGTSREEAAYAARREFGNVALIEERSREVWGLARLENLTADVAFAIRQLRRNPGLAFAVCLSLALGIGATTVVFSVVYAVLINPYPYIRKRIAWFISTCSTRQRFSPICSFPVLNSSSFRMTKFWMVPLRWIKRTWLRQEEICPSRSWQGIYHQTRLTNLAYPRY